MSTTSYSLYWNVSMRNFDVEHTDEILGRNVKFRGSMSRLPISVAWCSKESQPEVEAQRRGLKFDFWKG